MDIDRRWKRAHAAFKANPRPAIAHLIDCLDALMQPTLHDPVCELMSLAFVSSQHGGDIECFGCCEPWRDNRPLTTVLILERLPERPDGDIENGYLAGLCRRCADRGWPLVRQAVQREFECTPLDVRWECGTA